MVFVRSAMWQRPNACAQRSRTERPQLRQHGWSAGTAQVDLGGRHQRM